jgi:integrase/recombinase XerC
MIESFQKYLLFEKRYSQHTIQAYKTDLSQFRNFLSSNFSIESPAEADHNSIRAWVVSLVEANQSNRTVNRKMATLRAFYKFLLKREQIEKDPSRRIKSLKLSRKLPTFVREDDMTKILDHVDFPDDFSGKRDQIVMELLYGTGIRLSELIELKVHDINRSRETIKVLGKRNKERIIPVSRTIIDLIFKYKEKLSVISNNNSHLIVTDSGDKAYPMLIYRIVKKYLDLFVTLDKKSPHVLRHTYATHLLNKGADLNAVKDLLGHSSLAATQVYTHNTIDKLKKVFDKAHPKA